MSEYELQLMASLRIIWLAVFTYLYGLGGINGKWHRRFVGSFFLTWGVVAFSFWAKSYSPWLYLYFPLLMGSLSLGYGAETTLEKVKKRFIYGLACSVSALPIVIVNQSWLLYLWYSVIVCLTSVFLGVLNPTRNSRWEETTIALTIGLSLFL